MLRLQHPIALLHPGHLTALSPSKVLEPPLHASYCRLTAGHTTKNAAGQLWHLMLCRQLVSNLTPNAHTTYYDTICQHCSGHTAPHVFDISISQHLDLTEHPYKAAQKEMHDAMDGCIAQCRARLDIRHDSCMVAV